MNKSLIFCIVLTVCLSGLAAAEYSAENLSKGLRIGFNRSTLVSADFDFKAYNGYCLGGFLNYRSSDRFSYQFELLFHSKGYVRENVAGYNYDQSDTVIYDKLSIILGYLEVPISAKFSIIPEGVYRPYVIGGGYTGFLLWDKLRLEYFGPVVESDIKNSKKVDVGTLIGAGIDLKAGEKSWLFFEVRYEISFIGPIQNANQKIRALAFQAGYWF